MRRKYGNKHLVVDFLMRHPEILDEPSRVCLEKVKSALPGVDIHDDSVMGYIQETKRKTKSREPVSTGRSSERFSYSYDSRNRYQIQAGTESYKDVPGHDIQELVQTYALGGTRGETSEKMLLRGRTLSPKQVGNLVRALGVSKDSLPLAPHVMDNTPPEELPDLTRRITHSVISARLRADESKYWKKTAMELMAKVGELEDITSVIGESIQKNPPLTFPSLEFDASMDPYEGVLFISDWHVGQRFESPVGTYNREVFRDRLHKLSQEVHDWLRAYKRPLAKLHVAIGGDMVDGVLPMRPQHTMEQDLWEGDQVDHASQGLAWLIEGIYRRAGCPVSCWSVGGNHDRAGGDRNSDPNRVVAQWLAQLTAQRLPRAIEWHHEKSEVAAWRSHDTMLLLSHGDRCPKDPRKLVHPFRTPGVNTYLVMTGHKHTPHYAEDNDIVHVQSSSLVGADQFGSYRLGVSSRPSQVFIEIRKGKHPRTTIMPVS